MERIKWAGELAWKKQIETVSPRWRIQKGNPRKRFNREVQTLLELNKRQLSVPAVLHVSDDVLVVADAGSSLLEFIREPDLEHRRSFAALVAAGKALSVLHQNEVAHGRPALRDICMKNDEITFIDWESAPRIPASPRHLANDVLIFFFGIVEHCGTERPEAGAALQGYRSSATEELWQAARKKSKKLSYLKKIFQPVLKRFEHKREFKALEPTLRFFANNY